MVLHSPGPNPAEGQDKESPLPEVQALVLTKGDALKA